MATIFLHPTLGDDSRTYAQAQSTSTPWKTPMFAFRHASVLASDIISIGRPGDGALTWSGADAVIDSTSATGSATNVSKAVTFRTAAGVQATFTTATGASYLAGKSGSTSDIEGNPTHTVRGHCWRFINPANGMRFELNTESEATTTFTQTGTKPAEIDGGYSSCIYFVRKGAQGGELTNHFVDVIGIKIARFDGNGVCMNLTKGVRIVDYDITDTATGIRWEDSDGSRVATTLNGATAAGATSAVLTSAASMVVGQPLGIFDGKDTEVRLIASISTNTVTFEPGPSGRLGLHYPHASGVEVRTIFGAEGGRSYDNGQYGQADVGGGGNDFGAEGYSAGKGTKYVLAMRGECYGNYGRTGSPDFGIDGGAFTPYALGPNSKVVVTEMLFHDSHSLLESGTDSGQNPPNDNGGFIFTFNRCWGRNDYQSEFSNSPTAPLCLARAVELWVIRRNSFYIFDGPTANGGIRFSTTGTFAGTQDNLYIGENIIAIKYDSAIYDHAAHTAFPASSTIDRNLLYRTAGTNVGARHHNGSTTYAFTEAGRVAYNTATGFAANDKWATDPRFVAPENGDLRLQEDSPARGMAANGDDIGALDYVAEATAMVHDTFSRTVATGATDLGSATPTGGTVTKTTQGTSTLAVDGSAAVAVLAAVNHNIRFYYGASSPVNAIDVVSEWWIDEVPVGGSAILQKGVMFTDIDTDGYLAQVFVAPAGTWSGNFVKRVGTTQSLVGAGAAALTAASLPNFVALTHYKTRFQREVSGGVSTLRQRTWRAADVEPAAWDFTTTDSTSGLQGAGRPVYRAVSSGSMTNLPYSMYFGEVFASDIALPVFVPRQSFRRLALMAA